MNRSKLGSGSPIAPRMTDSLAFTKRTYVSDLVLLHNF
jgi:hypothetical protein